MPPFFSELRKFKLDELLFLIGELTRLMFDEDKPVRNIPFERRHGLLKQSGRVTVTAWNLHDMAYLSICETNDFRGRRPTEHDLVNLCNEFLIYDDSRSAGEFRDLKHDDWVLKFAVGFSQKQFWYQERYRLREQFNREVELLEFIPQEVGSRLDLNAAIYEKTGFNLREFRKLLFGLFTIGMINSDLTTFSFNGSLSKLDPCLTAYNVKSVLDLYVSDYHEYRQSPLKENHLFLKPIVRTSSNRLISVSQYLLARKIVDGPFWIVRDYYCSCNSQSFTNEFGLLYERYVEKLLQHFLPFGGYFKIAAVPNEKRADWIIDTDNFRIIVEQKSTLATLGLRTAYPDVETIHKYLESFKEAVIQLDITERAYYAPGKKHIKLVLHYETLFISDGAIRPAVIETVKDHLSSLEGFFFLDIGEFEHLVQILSENSTVGEAILLEKLRVEQEHSAVGKEFSQIIPNFYKKSNQYVDKIINHYDSFWSFRIK